jgi:hypothetical protein
VAPPWEDAPGSGGPRPKLPVVLPVGIVAFFAMVLVMPAATRGKPSRGAFALLGLVAVMVMAASCGSPAKGPLGRTLRTLR